jgi:hypothetical protein
MQRVGDVMLAIADDIAGSHPRGILTATRIASHVRLRSAIAKALIEAYEGGIRDSCGGRDLKLIERLQGLSFMLKTAQTMGDIAVGKGDAPFKVADQAIAEINRLNAATASPEEIAAAWSAWKSRHGGKLGPGPAFVEAINAAFAARSKATSAA